jgi:DNA-binding CsgD family transcriptional regulator
LVNDQGIHARDVWEAMLSTPFPFALIDPSTHSFVDANDEYAALLGIDVPTIRGLSLLSLYDHETANRIKSLNRSFENGGLRRTGGEAPMRRPDGTVIELKGWARRIEGLAEGPLIVASAVETTNNAEPSDLPWIRRAPHAFGLSPDRAGAFPDGSEIRASKLEQHLWRIGLEVQAAGLLPLVGETPSADLVLDLIELSSRQREIVAKLVAGKRVPEIASDMYLSPSTIRNHLTAVFRKFGVHSQVELITLLKHRSGSTD